VFYPYVEVVFNIDGEQHNYHIPLVLSSFGYSTYMGS
jgi:5-hydroxyisourate hydrolase